MDNCLKLLGFSVDVFQRLADSGKYFYSLLTCGNFVCTTITYLAGQSTINEFSLRAQSFFLSL